MSALVEMVDHRRSTQSVDVLSNCQIVIQDLDMFKLTWSFSYITNLCMIRLFKNITLEDEYLRFAGNELPYSTRSGIYRIYATALDERLTPPYNFQSREKYPPSS